MHTKHQITSTRKILYGIMLLGLALSAFGAGNLPSVRAQAASVSVENSLVLETLTNDDFDTPVSFSSLPYEITQDTTTATTNPDDPVFPCGSLNQGSNSVWYSFTPSENLTITAKTSSDLTTYDTMLALWSGTRTNLTNVACNDDAQVGIGSEISAILQAGVTYYIEVAGFDSSASAPAKIIQSSELMPSVDLLASGGTLNLSVDFGCPGEPNDPMITTRDNQNNAGTGNRDCDMDTYLYNNSLIQPIEFSIDVPSVSGITSAELLLLNWDVDENSGEVDNVYFNGNYAGILVGADDAWSTTTLTIDPAWVVAGDNLVRIDVDTTNINRAVKTDWGQLVFNGREDTATIRTATLDRVAYSPGNVINTTVEVDTYPAPSQALRTEVNLRNAAGQILAGTSTEHTALAKTDDPISVNLTVPESAPLGTYNIQILVYDLTSSVIQDSEVLPFEVQSPNGELLFPANGSTLLNNRPTFDWNNIPGAIGYNIQVAKNSAFTLLVSNVTLTGATNSSYTPTVNLAAKTIMYWRIRAKLTATTYGPWSEVWSFTTGNPPPPPLLTAPAANTLVTALTVKLDWKDVVMPSGTTFQKYEVQMATDAAFTIGASLTDTPISELTTSELTPNTKYYWRVRIYDTLGQYSNWSIPRYFRAALSAPNSLTPGSPTSAEQLFTDRPTFTWDAVAGAASYTVEVSKSNTFATKVINATATTNSYTHTIDLAPNTSFFWRVKANGTNGPSLYSQMRMFRTANPPSAPTLAAPAANALITTTTPLLNWNNSTVPTGTTFRWYEIQVDTSNTFDGAVSAYTTELDLNNSQYTPDPLLNGVTYYWRVRSINTANEFSGWSLVRSFRVIYAGPTNLNVTTALKPVFTWDPIVGAISYTIQVSKNNAFTLLVVNKTVYTATYTQLTNLLAGTPYYWRVRANGAYGPGLWSSATFTTP